MVVEREVSVIVPTYNEEQSLPILVDRLVEVLKKERIDGEVVVVDDGSTDKTSLIIDELAAKYGVVVKGVRHRVNKGKSLAFQTGFDNSLGRIIVMLDADMQYDPEELPKFLDLIEEGCDVVSGWRDYRRYPLRRRVPSKIYNFMVRRLLTYGGHDCDCGFKAFRREVLEGIRFRKGLHRYITAIASEMGYRVGEVRVNLYPRASGRMKFGVSRLLYGLLDFIALKLRLSFLERPMIVFGLSGLVSMGLGISCAAYLLFESLLYGVPFHFRPLAFVSIFLITMGIQFFSLGLLAEAISVLREDVQSLHRDLRSKEGKTG